MTPSSLFFRLRGFVVIAAATLAVACSQPPPKPPAPPPSGPSKMGVVGLVSMVKERGVNQDNWKGVIGSLFSNDTDSTVTAVKYEVTVIYDDGTHGTVMVDKDLGLQPGQRVRVTGNKLEPVARR